MKTFTVKAVYSDKEAAERFEGQMLDESHFDFLVDENADVFTDKGEPLLKLRKKVYSNKIAQDAYSVLYKAATTYGNRGVAAGVLKNKKEGVAASATRFNRSKKDGTVSKTLMATTVPSGVVGAFDRVTRFPYCRLTKFSVTNFEKMPLVYPMLEAVNQCFADNMPERYAVQKRCCEATHSDYVIPKTAFTTLTVNRNWRTACHTDAGDLKEGFGVMSAIIEGKFDGGYLVLPQYRVAANMRHTDVLLANVHQWHGNTEIVPLTRFYNRLSVVFYYRRKIIGCKSLEQELERAKTRKSGTPMYEQNELILPFEKGQ